jgi:DNA-binding PadR family transcriptional regulator
MPSARPIPQGTLDMLILQALSVEAAHGYALALTAAVQLIFNEGG